jgi:hypothetical protein
VSVEVEHRKAPERLPGAAETPWELRVSRRSADLRAGERPWVAGPTRRGLRVTAQVGRRGLKRARGRARAKARATARRRRAPKGVRRLWDHGRGTRAERAQATGSPRSVRPRIPQSSGLHRTGDERPQRQARGSDAALRHGPSVRKSLASENPMSGSGPSESARPEGDQSVEGARNPEDGRRSDREVRTKPIPPPTSLKGRGTSGGATRSGRTGEGAST